MFFLKNKKENKNIKSANDVAKELIFKKALEENKEKQAKIDELNKAILVALQNAEELRKSNKNLENNLSVLSTSIENIKDMCHNIKGKVISKNKILKELGE